MIEPHVSPILINSDMPQYCKTLMDYARVYFQQVKGAFCKPPTGGQTFHNLETGEWVFWKQPLRKVALEPRWKGSYQVLLTTQVAAKSQGLAPWGPRVPVEKGSSGLRTACEPEM